MSNNQQVNQLIAQLLQLANNSNNDSISHANLATLLLANQNEVESEVKQAGSSKTTRKLSGYNVFLREETKKERILVDQEMPNETKTKQARETTSRLAKKWKAMTDAEKAPFIGKAKGVAPEQKTESQVVSNPEYLNNWIVFCKEQREQRGKLRQQVLSEEWAKMSQAQKDQFKNKIKAKSNDPAPQTPVIRIEVPNFVGQEQDVDLILKDENDE